MKQWKQRKKVWVFAALLVMLLAILPTQRAWAADKYQVKGYGNKNQTLYTQEDAYLGVYVVKNGKRVKKEVKIKWESSNEKIVQVDSNNTTSYTTLTGVKKGTATVTASYRGASFSYKVTVKGATIRPGFSDEKTAYVPAGQTVYMDIVGDGWKTLSGDEIKFSSSNKSVAKVVADGGYNIKGLKSGKAKITAKSKLGTVSINVVVLPKYQVVLKNFKNTKDGYTFDVVNKSEKEIKIVEVATGWDDGFSGGYSLDKVKGNAVTVKKGETKTVTVFSELHPANGKGKIERTEYGRYDIGLGIKYEGKSLSIWYDDENATWDPFRQHLF